MLMIVSIGAGCFFNHIISPLTFTSSVAAASDQSVQWDRYLEAVKDWGTWSWTTESTDAIVIPSPDWWTQKQNDLRVVKPARQNRFKETADNWSYAANKDRAWSSISVKWFPEDSDANRIARYRYENSKWDMDMLQTFVCENWGFNVATVSPTHDFWICQLHGNSTNNVWILDERWGNREYQAKACLDKWNAVQNKNAWACYKIRNNYGDRFILSPKS